MTHEPAGRFYTVPQAARLLRVSPSTIWRWIDAEKLSAYRVGPRAIRIKQEDLDAMIRPVGARPRDTRPDGAPVSFERPSDAELARRQALYEEIVALRPKGTIAPLTTADLVRMAREEERRGYGKSHRRAGR